MLALCPGRILTLQCFFGSLLPSNARSFTIFPISTIKATIITVVIIIISEIETQKIFSIELCRRKETNCLKEKIEFYLLGLGMCIIPGRLWIKWEISCAV